MGEICSSYKILVGKPEGKRPFGRPRRRWAIKLECILGKQGGGVWDWLHLAQDRDKWWALVTTKMNLWVP